MPIAGPTAAAGIASLEWCVQPEVGGIGDDDDIHGGEMLSPQPCARSYLWQRHWKWELPGRAVAEALLRLLVIARRAEGWWCVQAPTRSAVLLCHGVPLRSSDGGRRTALLSTSHACMPTTRALWPCTSGKSLRQERSSSRTSPEIHAVLLVLTTTPPKAPARRSFSCASLRL